MVRVTWGEHLQDELIVRTAGPDAKVHLSISGGEDFQLHIGEGAPMIGEHHQVVLDPADASLLQVPEAVAGDEGALALRVWYVEPTVRQTAAQDLSEEEMRELEAMGYLAD